MKSSKSRKDRKYPVYAGCTIEGSRIELFTGIFIHDESWDPDGQMMNLNQLVKRINSFVGHNIGGNYRQLIGQQSK